MVARRSPSIVEHPASDNVYAVPRVGTIIAIAKGGRAVVEFDGVVHEARVVATLKTQQLADASAARLSAVLVFEQGDANLPIVVGLLPGAESPVDTGIVRTVSPLEPQDGADRVIDAAVDGRRVRITAKDEVVLECGEASITLRRNGKVVIRGAHVESHSIGTNRIKGGQVRIN